MQTNTDRISGSAGTFTINDALAYTFKFDTIQVDADTVFAILEINGVDVKANYVSTPANAVKPTVITCDFEDLSFTKIQLTSGQVTCVKFK